MTYSDQPAARLGVLSIISIAFSITFRRTWAVVGIAVALQLIFTAINHVVLIGAFGIDPSSVAQVITIQQSTAYIAYSGVFGFVIISLTISMVALVAFDAYSGERFRLGFYINRALRSIIPIVICSIIVMAIASIPHLLVVALVTTWSPAGLAFILSAVAMLYVFAMFCVVNQSIAIERTGFVSLSRSLQLTKGYRWSLIGLMLVVFAMFLLLFLVVGAAMAVINGFSVLAISLFVVQGSASIVFQLVNAVTGGIVFAFLSAVGVAGFVRLREIHDGIGMGEIADVFG